MILRMDVWSNEFGEVRFFLEHTVLPFPQGVWTKRGTIEVGMVPAF